MEKRINQRSFTIGTSSSEIAKAMYGFQGSRRISMIIKNTSTASEVITLGIDKNAITGEGLVLNAGETISFSQDGGYMPPQGQVTAIASAATAKLSLYEEVEN